MSNPEENAFLIKEKKKPTSNCMAVHSGYICRLCRCRGLSRNISCLISCTPRFVQRWDSRYRKCEKRCERLDPKGLIISSNGLHDSLVSAATITQYHTFESGNFNGGEKQRDAWTISDSIWVKDKFLNRKTFQYIKPINIYTVYTVCLINNY